MTDFFKYNLKDILNKDALFVLFTKITKSDYNFNLTTYNNKFER